MKIKIGKTAGFCYGVERAVEGAKKELKNKTEKNLSNKTKNKLNYKTENVRPKIYCLGEIVHNKEVVKDLENRGVEFIETLKEIKEQNSLTIIRAHGIPKETYEECKSKDIEIADYTCPNVLRIHDIAKEHSEKGYYIVLVGSSKHPENIGTISFCGDKISVIERLEDVPGAIKEIEKSKKSKCLVIAQTTYSMEKFEKIEKELKQNLSKNIELKIQNTICMATELRQRETKELSQKVDKMIIIGGKNSSNTKKLYEVATKYCKSAICIETAEELTKEDLEGCKTIGIMAGASTPKQSIEEVVEKIQGKTPALR